MINIVLMITYVFSAVAGSTLIKYGSLDNVGRALFTLPFFNMNITLMSLIGIVAYGVSFFTYIILLTRFDLSFISPLLIAFVYLLLMATAFIIFKEEITTYKLLGCSLILVGIILILAKQ